MSNVISFTEEIVKKTEKEIMEILISLVEDYELEVKVKQRQIHILLEQFMKQYEKNEIVYWFYEMMTGHFEDIAITAVEQDAKVDIDFILNQLTLFELLDSPVEILPEDTRNTVKQIRKTLERGPKLYEGNNHTKH